MNLLFHPIFLEHDTGEHPENAKRLSEFKDLETAAFDSGEKYLTLIHTPGYINRAKDVSTKGGGILDPETTVSERSYQAACMAVGAAISASEHDDFALVRPPGHHAFPDHGGGFCVFNSVAIAARKLVSEGKRVAIVDIDGHVGDGTEKIFYDTGDVLYISLHQYPAYPGTGTVDQIGTGKGSGYTVNFPLSPGTSDDIYLRAFGIALTILGQFRPDTIAVSAGFDGHQDEILLQLKLSSGLYARVATLLKTVTPHVFAVLEGGYNPDALHRCVMNFIAGINGDKPEFQEDVRESTILSMEYYLAQESELKKNLAPYWKI